MSGRHKRDFPVAAVRFLRCPVCSAEFRVEARLLRCLNGHTYDVAQQGYVNLLPGDARPGTADTADMVAAREAFLAAGHFAGLREFIAGVAETVTARAGGSAGRSRNGAEAGLNGDGVTRRDVAPGGCTTDPGRGSGVPPDAAESADCVVEVGAGTGYYLADVLDHLPGRVGLALDISKFAARRAARAHEGMAAVVCDAWKGLPIADGAAALVLDIFAPRNPAEFRRILRPGGALLVVTPSPGHLRELVTGLGLLSVDERKPERLEQALAAHFCLQRQDDYEERLTLEVADAAALAAMGPSAHHLSPERVSERLAAFGAAVQVTLSVTVATYAPRTPSDGEAPEPA